MQRSDENRAYGDAKPLFRAASVLLSVTSVIWLAGCATNESVSSTWHEGLKPASAYERVLVVAKARDTDKRLSFEDLLATKISSEFTTAVPSTRYMESDAPINEATLKPVVEESNSQIVIITQVTNIEVTPVKIDAYTDVTPRRQKGTAFRYDYVEKELPAIMSAEFTTSLNTEIYEAATGAHVYSLVSSSTGQESINDVIAALSDSIAKRLRADRVVK